MISLVPLRTAALAIWACAQVWPGAHAVAQEYQQQNQQFVPKGPTPAVVEVVVADVNDVRDILRRKVVGTYWLRPNLQGKMDLSTERGFDLRPEMTDPTSPIRRTEDLLFTTLEISKFREAIFNAKEGSTTMRAFSCRPNLPGNASLRELKTIGEFEERIGAYNFWNGESCVAMWDLIAADATNAIVVMRLVAYVAKPPASKDPNVLQPVLERPEKTARVVRYYIKRGELRAKY